MEGQSIKSTSHTSIVASTMRQKAKSGDAKAQEWVNEIRERQEAWRLEWQTTAELSERRDRIRALDNAHYHAQRAKTAKGDKAQASIQRQNEANRARYHAPRKRAAMGNKEAQSQLEREHNIKCIR